jgi:putative ABC transport system substrate-binding protein
MREDFTMRRSAIGLMLILALFVAPRAADNQQMKKVPMIGVLSGGSPPSSPDWKQRSSFLQELRTLGWIEGQNITVEYRWAFERYDRLADVAAELVRLPVDVIVALDTRAIDAARYATTTTPIVMLTPVDPVALGYVASLARPGGNITGVGSQSQELSGKLLELLKKAVPEVTKMAVLVDQRHPDIKGLVSETEGTARALGIQLHLLEVRYDSEFKHMFETAIREGSGALLILPGRLATSHERQLAALAVQHRLPAIYTGRSFAEAGGLLAYGPKRADYFRLAASYVDRILKGAKAADLPVERVTTFEFVVNLKTAQVLGLTIPPTLLMLADEVIR